MIDYKICQIWAEFILNAAMDRVSEVNIRWPFHDYVLSRLTAYIAGVADWVDTPDEFYTAATQISASTLRSAIANCFMFCGFNTGNITNWEEFLLNPIRDKAASVARAFYYVQHASSGGGGSGGLTQAEAQQVLTNFGLEFLSDRIGATVPVNGVDKLANLAERQAYPILESEAF